MVMFFVLGCGFVCCDGSDVCVLLLYLKVCCVNLFVYVFVMVCDEVLGLIDDDVILIVLLFVYCFFDFDE